MRVITGTARGRKLLEPSGMDIRPTTDMVKEAVFNIVQFDVEGAPGAGPFRRHGTAGHRGPLARGGRGAFSWMPAAPP